MGASVTVVALSESQRDDAIRLGAKEFIASNDEAKLQEARGTLNFVVDTVPVPHNLSAILGLLTFRGVIAL